MTKRAIITRADDLVQEWSDFTHPLFRTYADKCDADFRIIKGKAPFLDDDNQPHYRILKVFELLQTYDRILCLDSDMIINKNCPNIFEEVPENMIGSIYEDVGTRVADRRHKIAHIQALWGDVNWRTGYTNAGTFLVSKQHQDIFRPHNNKFWLAGGSVDLHVSYNIHKYNLKVHPLEYKWNHMTMFSEDWNGNANRFDSYIIHYAGRGIFEEDQISPEALMKHVQNTDRQACKLEQAKLDYKRIYG